MQVIDQCYDQGYGSERSPEDEMPPPLPQLLGIEHQYNPMIVNSVMMPQGYHDGSSQMLEMDSHQRLHQQAIQQNYDFITEGEPSERKLFPGFLKASWEGKEICFGSENSGKFDQKSFNFHHPRMISNFELHGGTWTSASCHESG